MQSSAGVEPTWLLGKSLGGRGFSHSCFLPPLVSSPMMLKDQKKDKSNKTLPFQVSVPAQLPADLLRGELYPGNLAFHESEIPTCEKMQW